MLELTSNYLWLKAFHIIFVVTWFAGLFYLPRLFIYHCVASDGVSLERFKIMERRLFIITTIGGFLTLVFGFATLATVPGYMQQPWMHAKLLLVGLLIGYHIWCYRLLKRLADGLNQHSQRWYRWFNEVPSILLIAIVLLVVVKPQW